MMSDVMGRVYLEWVEPFQRGVGLRVNLLHTLYLLEIHGSPETFPPLMRAREREREEREKKSSDDIERDRWRETERQRETERDRERERRIQRHVDVIFCQFDSNTHRLLL